MDGFIAAKKGLHDPEPWQDEFYISKKAALERKGEGISVHVMHRMDFENLKELRNKKGRK